MLTVVVTSAGVLSDRFVGSGVYNASQPDARTNETISRCHRQTLCLPSVLERTWSCFATSVLWQTTCFSLERLMAALTSRQPLLQAD